jgi:short-subunit dehydrogenase
VVRAGPLINIASMTAFQPLPYLAVHGASKSFLMSISEGLAGECRAVGRIRSVESVMSPCMPPAFRYRHRAPDWA